MLYDILKNEFKSIFCHMSSERVFVVVVVEKYCFCFLSLCLNYCILVLVILFHYFCFFIEWINFSSYSRREEQFQSKIDIT